MPPLNRPVAWLAAILTALALGASSVHADELQDASRMMKQGQLQPALDRVNQYLAQKPRDAQGRFLKGLILAEQNKVGDAIDVFSKLSQDYPELPEPYNNLAVLYATQGQYEKARQQLEMSIRTHPSYATAYENLGDVYTKLASQAYDRALQIDSGNATAQNKLSLVRELIGSGNRAGRPSAVASAPVPAAPPKAAAPQPAAPTAPVQPAAPVATPAKPEPKVEARAAKPEASKPEPARSTTAAADSEEVLKSVRGWAAAWARKDANGYLAAYAKNFKTPKGESRSAWESARKQRIAAPKKIEVRVDSPKISVEGDSATVKFRQYYRSDHLQTTSSKTLVLVKADGKWLIQQERVGS
jgi:tetratricopeptide (TPR) repeat protein